ncbi:MAG TPA: aspartate aminotransferase family protein [Candidatus Dormibacteraeota bacterium]|nr:aspartate aminotransferase family protein [Candidatus Dormibacteraeota bacterium]
MATTKTREVPAGRVTELIGAEEDRFRKARPRSHQLWTEAQTVLARGVPSSFQDAAPHPIFIERGKGSRVWDVDGHEYVDFHNGFGVMVVGHAHPRIVEAVSGQVRHGSHFAQPVENAVIVARELARRFHQPKWRFTNSGTESTLDAVRIARGFTGRERIIKIEASYHGHHDSLMVSVEPPPEHMGPADDPNSFPQSEGIPAAIVELTTVVPFNDLAALEKAFARHPGEVAAVIVEPAMMNVGIVLPDQGFLDRVKEIAHTHGALLIFDEVKTGVTIAPGGATERFHITPDLVALAKAIGGGLPCGAVGGREDVMGVVEDKRVAQMGTFNGNPLTMAASRVTLTEILDARAYAHFDALAETLQGGLDDAIGSYDLPFHVITLAARGGVTYRAKRVRNYRDYLEIDKSFAYLSWLYQSNRGVIMAPGAEENWTLSVQHSVEDVQRYVDNFVEMAKDLRR